MRGQSYCLRTVNPAASPHSVARRVKVFRETPSCFPASVAVMYPFHQSSANSSNSSGIGMRSGPNRTPRSSAAAIRMLKDKGVKKIRFLCIIAAPEGVEKMKREHPDVALYIGALDDHLNEHKYIVPGLGDAGDRIFGTK